MCNQTPPKSWTVNVYKNKTATKKDINQCTDKMEAHKMTQSVRVEKTLNCSENTPNCYPMIKIIVSIFLRWCPHDDQNMMSTWWSKHDVHWWSKRDHLMIKTWCPPDDQNMMSTDDRNVTTWWSKHDVHLMIKTIITFLAPWIPPGCIWLWEAKRGLIDEAGQVLWLLCIKQKSAFSGKGAVPERTENKMWPNTTALLQTWEGQ